MINNNNKMSNISITTAIDYANGLPHIGHLFEKTIADFLFRYYSSFSRNMLCNIGLDEHGLKIQNFSLKLTILPINSTNITCNKFKVFFKNFCINYSKFIRTSSFSHFKTCNYLIKFLKTHTYLDYYNGYYSVKEELFLTDRDLVNGYFWSSKKSKIYYISEKNLFLNIKKNVKYLRYYMVTNPGFIYPTFYEKIILNSSFLKINNLCITRPYKRLFWGVKIPKFNKTTVFYVWFDALINYITISGFGNKKFNINWPPTFQIIGKDILTPSHFYYWLSILKYLNLSFPRKIIIHGWWLFNKKKISKSSLGSMQFELNKINFNSFIDSLRFFLLYKSNFNKDSNFSSKIFYKTYSTQLINGLGNFMFRIFEFIKMKLKLIRCSNKILDFNIHFIKTIVCCLYKKIFFFTSGLFFKKIIISFVKIIKLLNLYISLNKIWIYTKSVLCKNRKLIISEVIFNVLRMLLLIIPVIHLILPKTLKKISVKFKLSELWYKNNSNTCAIVKNLFNTNLFFK